MTEMDLTEADFFSGSGRVADRFMTKCITDNKTGICIAAPPRVVVPKQRILPLVGYWVLSFRDAMRPLAVSDAAVVIASRIDTGRVLAARAFAPEQVVLGRGKKLEPPDGRTGKTFAIDLFDYLAVPREPASYAIWIVLRDMMSNQARTEVGAPSPDYEDPEVLRFVAEYKKKHAPPPPAAYPATLPEGQVPSYRKGASSPPLPEGGAAGVRLAASRVVMLDTEGQAALVHGAFRLAVPENRIVRSHRADGATAVLPITLIVTGSDDAGPLVFPLEVPVFAGGEGSVEPGKLVEGYFTIDLFGFEDMWDDARTHFIYGVAGESISQPALMAFVSKDELEARA